MMQRELEPEVMDDPAESRAYDDMDHSTVNRQFVADLLALGAPGEEVLDLGTGTARIPIELCEQFRKCRVMGSDAAISMLEIARVNVALASFEHRIQLHHGDSKQLGFADSMFDAVISNSLLHHLPEPRLAISEMIRVARPGGRIFVRDLMRPATRAEVESLVSTYAKEESDECQQLLRQSLLAALTQQEMRDLVASCGFEPTTVCATSDRHLTWSAVKPSDS